MCVQFKFTRSNSVNFLRSWMIGNISKSISSQHVRVSSEHYNKCKLHIVQQRSITQSMNTVGTVFVIIPVYTTNVHNYGHPRCFVGRDNAFINQSLLLVKRARLSPHIFTYSLVKKNNITKWIWIDCLFLHVRVHGARTHTHIHEVILATLLQEQK